MRGHGPDATTRDLRQRLRHVYWIGGAPAAGKSTIARRLADRYGLDLYLTDDLMPDHARRSTAADSPYLERFKAMDMDERWVTRPPETMLETFHWFRGEGFPLIVEDLLRCPAGTRVIAEGFRLLPHLIVPLLDDADHAVWLLPTPAFRDAALESRGPLWDIPSKTSNPERARRSLLERDRMFTDRLVGEARRLGCRTLEQDVGVTEEDAIDQVARSFGLPNAGEPR
jgi:2-phosphoglycerate kinase